jgi:hypothetical protein
VYDVSIAGAEALEEGSKSDREDIMAGPRRELDLCLSGDAVSSDADRGRVRPICARTFDCSCEYSGIGRDCEAVGGTDEAYTDDGRRVAA